MAMVNTVAGQVSSDELGRTYMHEHIFVVSPEMQHYWPGYQGWDPDEAVEKARAALRKLHREQGVDTILDPTVAGLGRDIRAVARAVEGTGLNVVAATGWYVYNELPFTFFYKDMDGKIAELEMLFLRDYEEGLEGTSIKPGVIKCSTDFNGVTPDVEALLRASARAHLGTGLPITTHTDSSSECGLAQAAIFREEGVDMGAVVVGHCNQSGDLGYLETLIDQGVYIGFDRCGIESPAASLDAQMDNLAELCRRGYAERIVLSHDDMLFLDLLPPGSLEQLLLNYPYGYLDAQMLPGLRKRGIDESVIQTMVVDNPRRYFGRASARAT